MTKKIFNGIFFTAVLVLVACFAIITAVLYSHFSAVQQQTLQEELTLVATGVQRDGVAFLQTLQAERCRFTLVDAAGNVLYDTKTGDKTDTENHADRTEIREAMQNGVGESTRYSSTLLEKTMYRAVRLPDGSVLRISLAQATVGVLLIGMLQPLLAILLAASILAAVLAFRFSKRVVEPLNHLDLEHPLENETYAELAPLLGRIHRQRMQLAEQQMQLREKTDAFTQVTDNMREGLILLDEKGTVLSINPAACRIFQASAAASIGQDFLMVDHTHALVCAMQQASTHGHAEMRMERAGREYQLDISRIENEGKRAGAVLLAFDVTEEAFAQRNRREFTANVSHELKTPLQGIIGSAELLENDMVQPQDRVRFLGHIRTEAARLLALIEDIIRLSQLDEGVALPFESVDLYLLAQQAIQSVEQAALQRSVTLTLQGSSVYVQGVRQLLQEILYNLCDNAVKYNVTGGSVKVSVEEKQDMAYITVTDSGIGIPPESQSRVFERFYRVDKSHSKASGGTGLGLSIVKHAVQLHGGTVSLNSELGNGTRVCVQLPRQHEQDV